jgi:Spy/CpxP family protein refolding chaperone
MRKTSLILIAVGLLAGCRQEGATSIETTAGSALEALASLAQTSDFSYGIRGGIPGRGLREFGALSRLPDSLALSAAQDTEIDALLAAFQTANQVDLDSLAAIHTRVHEARRAGATRAEIDALLALAAPIHERVAVKLTALRTAIDAVLTASQRAWLVANTRLRCTLDAANVLTEAQKAQITALSNAYKTANAADLAAVQAARDSARAVRRSGGTKTEADAILATVAAAMTRLQAAGEALRTAIDAVLTPAQRASNCFGRGFCRGGLDGLRIGHFEGGRGGRGGDKGGRNRGKQ